MSKMRNILRMMMDAAGHNSYDIHRKTGLQPSTIRRYLNGDSSHLKPATVETLANLYGITESQLRGDVPIDGLKIPEEKPELREILPLDEYRFVRNVKKMDDEARAIMWRLAEMLVAEPQAAYGDPPEDRRKEDVYPNPQLRVGESRHKSPQTKRVRKIPTDGSYTTTKPRQTA